MRTLLVLARVSNVPTVWSNCLAAWLLSGGTSWSRWCLVCLGATLLYTGGMFLNDAVDQEFDRRYRPERPIVSGRIRSRSVWMLSFAWLAAGWAIFLFFGTVPALIGTFLLVTIILYDLVHKRTALAPLLMAACRFLLYLLAASVVSDLASLAVVWPAAALAAYIVGLSYLARGESAGASFMRWTCGLLFVPALLFLLRLPSGTWFIWIAVGAQVSWAAWCLSLGNSKIRLPVPRGVAGLLAGIALVDWVAAAASGAPAAFLGLFVLALVLQRVAPAT